MVEYEVKFRGRDAVIVIAADGTSDEDIVLRVPWVRETIDRLKRSNPNVPGREIMETLARQLAEGEDHAQVRRRWTWTEWRATGLLCSIILGTTLGLGLIPWAIFFLVRWVARGFQSA
jgi:hypothetical protein